MDYIKELFDSSKNIYRQIESVVTFADNSEENLKNEINEYVVTDKLRDNYEKVIDGLERAFRDTSNEIGVWVSGFYGSGKSSFAKYLGYSFQKSLMVDGMSFGEKLMNRINNTSLKALHNTLIQKYNPLVVLIDLATQATAGITSSTVSDIMYYETLKRIGIKATDTKVMDFLSILQDEGKYEEFCEKVKEEGKDWENIQTNGLMANRYAAKYAPIVLPKYFSSSEEYSSIKVDSAENETERFKRLYSQVKQRLGYDRIIYILDEVGLYVAASDDLIRNMQGTMQILKSQFKGNVWLIATAQQTLTEDNPQAQINSDKLFKLNDRFPIKVDIEADDIKEIVTKRLLRKSQEGKEYLTEVYNKNEASIKLGTKLTNMDHSIYIKPITKDLFVDLYPFLPVHIDILMALLQKLASRSGGTGLRSVIRLIRDILVEGHLADFSLGKMATPDLFFDALCTYMEKYPDFHEIVISAKKAIELYGSDPLAVKACKTIAIMQLLDDFELSFDNVCSLLFQEIGSTLDKSELSKCLENIKTTPGVTLQEIDGRFRFMTNAILTVQDERSRINASESYKSNLMKELLSDILTPAPSVSIHGSKTLAATVELCRGRQNHLLNQGGEIKIVVRFVDASDFEKVHNTILTESTRTENKQTMYWLCTLPHDIERLLIDVVQSETIYNNHKLDSNKEIQDYLHAQQTNAEKCRQEITRLLRQSQDNSETICRGSFESVNGETYKTQALKKFAEDVFNKYPLASRSLPSSIVSDFYAHGDTIQLPPALNPFGIVSDDGAINTNYGAFVEIKEYIASHIDVSGSSILDNFSRASYGWSKDTIRYLIALMLKAGMIEVRSGAQSYKTFSKKAAEDMKNNQSFGHLGVSLNTDTQLNPAELYTAMTFLQELYNPQGIVPVLDKIAKASLKIARENSAEIETLKKDFENLGMVGTDIVDQAVNYLSKIIDSDGMEAPYLFAKDETCKSSLRYVNLVLKADEQGKLLSSIKKIKYCLSEAQKLPSSPMLKNFRAQMEEHEQAFNDLMNDSDCYSHTSDYADISSRIDEGIKQACAHYYDEASRQIQQKNDEICSSSDYSSLHGEQKQVVDEEMSKIVIQDGSSLECLHDMAIQFMEFYAPGGSYDRIKQLIDQFVSDNNSADHDDDNDSMVVHKQIKRHITSRDELQSIINELMSLLPKIDEGSSVDLSFLD